MHLPTVLKSSYRLWEIGQCCYYYRLAHTIPNKIQLFFVLKFRVSFKRFALSPSGRARCLSTYAVFVLWLLARHAWCSPWAIRGSLDIDA